MVPRLMPSMSSPYSCSGGNQSASIQWKSPGGCGKKWCRALSVSWRKVRKASQVLEWKRWQSWSISSMTCLKRLASSLGIWVASTNAWWSTTDAAKHLILKIIKSTSSGHSRISTGSSSWFRYPGPPWLAQSSQCRTVVNPSMSGTLTINIDY